MYIKNSMLTHTDGKSPLNGKRLNVVSLFCDLRDFSNWCESVGIEKVESLMKIQFERVVQICNDHHHDFHKFLGDGFVLVWEESEEKPLHLCLAHAIDAAFHLHKKYWCLSQDLTYELPPGYGIGISVGEAILLQPETFISEMNEVDFVGYPLNCAARMQGLAKAYGTVLSSAALDLLSSPDWPHTSYQWLLFPPSDAALRDAASKKGLKEKDRTEFKYLNFGAGYPGLWTVTGIP